VTRIPWQLAAWMVKRAPSTQRALSQLVPPHLKNNLCKWGGPGSRSVAAKTSKPHWQKLSIVQTT
jgi:hypothetical protein